jgi:hypothetical protein
VKLSRPSQAKGLIASTPLQSIDPAQVDAVEIGLEVLNDVPLPTSRPAFGC